MDPPIDIIDRARAGDAAAQKQVVEAYQARVFAVCAAMVPNDAEDLAQDTLLRTLIQLRRFDPNGPARLSTYILRIARNLCIDRVRAQRFRTSDRDASELAGGPSSDRQLEAAEDAEHVRRAVLALPDDQRVVVALRMWGELEYVEIAAIEGVPIGTIRSRLARARSTLRKLLAPSFMNQEAANAG